VRAPYKNGGSASSKHILQKCVLINLLKYFRSHHISKPTNIMAKNDLNEAHFPVAMTRDRYHNIFCVDYK